MNNRGRMWEEGGGQKGVKGGKWDNCNSIINKYIYIFLKSMVLRDKFGQGYKISPPNLRFPQLFLLCGLEYFTCPFQAINFFLCNELLV